jgi:dienelactone hydrolase
VPLVKDSLLRKKVDFLLIDRPGYGYSDFGRAMTDVKKQARIVYEISQKYASKYKQILMLGTSYGGTVATRFMMDYPGYLDAGILMSSSMAPGEEKTYEISYFMDRAPWLFPPLLMVANHEKLSHRLELEKMEGLWTKISNPIVFIHATADDLVYPSNVRYALKKLGGRVSVDTTWVKDGEHSLYWSNRDLVFRELYDFIDVFDPIRSRSLAGRQP